MSLQTVLDELRIRPGTAEVISIINPATEEQIGEFTDCGADAVEAYLKTKSVWAQL